MSVRWTARCCGAWLPLIAVVGLCGSASAQSAAQPAPTDKVGGVALGGAMDSRWTAALDVVAGTAPIADDSAAYVVTRTPAVVAVDLVSGATRWQVDAAANVSPAVAGGLTFVAVADGVRAVRSATGETAWHRVLEHPVSVAPGVGAERLVLSLANGHAVALRTSDGAVLWQTPLGAPAGVSPAATADRCYLALADGRVVALHASSGAPAWTSDLASRVTGVLPLDDEVLVGTTGALVSLDRRSGRPRWRWRLGTPVAGAPAADGRHIYVVGLDHLLRALDRRSGNLRWRRALPHRPASGVVLAASAVLVPSVSTEIPTFAAATGDPGPTITSTSEVGSALYFLATGRPTATRLLAVTTAGELVAFKFRFEPAPAPLADLPGVAVPEPQGQAPLAPPTPLVR